MPASHTPPSSSQADPSANGKPVLRVLLVICALIAVAFAFGGGGVRYGLANLLVQLTALGVLAFHRHEFMAFWRQSPIALRALVGSSLLIPILHLAPLPEGVWSALPGRDLVAQSLAAIDASGWRPASVDPARTLVALTGLIVPLTVLTVGWSIPRRHLMSVGWLIVLLGLICFLIGVIQVTTGGTSLVFYPERAATDLLYGTFANRNSTGLFLVGALVMAALLPFPRPHPAALPARLLICAALLLAVVLTRSRTAFVLAAIPIALGLAKTFMTWRQSGTSRADGNSNRASMAVFGGLTLVVVALGSVVAIAPGRVGEVVERFEATEDARTYIWEDATYSASRFWPLGAGMGTFDEVFQVDESLENLTKRRAGRAHNDYIELAIEAGLPGLVLAAGWLILVGWLSWRAGRSQYRWPAWGSGAILLAVALQSITDYPLRNQTMLAIAAFALLMLARIAQGSGQEGR
ncbi:MAG: O-antigen ligase family protein [Pseudomonadota bacterium]